MKPKDLTLIVPTKNEALNIHHFMASVPQSIKMIIVDASIDGTVDIIKKMNRENVCLIKDEGNIACARQLGAETAETDWLIFSDADVVFAGNYFGMLRGIHPGPPVAGLAGAKLSQRRYRVYYRLFSQWLRFCCAVGVPAASGSNMLVRRRALMEVGGFDRRLTCNEDTDLFWRLHRSGYPVMYEPRLKVFEFDHRRLDRGLGRKTFHSLLRCALLVCGFRSVLRSTDWGYWQNRLDNSLKVDLPN
jgi:GT2 family glycosyltransferase